jgi:hypothetical protein
LQQAICSACIGSGNVFSWLTASSKIESEFKVFILEEVASIGVNVGQGQEAVVIAVLPSSKWQKCSVSTTHAQVTFGELMTHITGFIL